MRYLSTRACNLICVAFLGRYRALENKRRGRNGHEDFRHSEEKRPNPHKRETNYKNKERIIASNLISPKIRISRFCPEWLIYSEAGEFRVIRSRSFVSEQQSCNCLLSIGLPRFPAQPACCLLLQGTPWAIIGFRNFAAWWGGRSLRLRDTPVTSYSESGQP